MNISPTFGLVQKKVKSDGKITLNIDEINISKVTNLKPPKTLLYQRSWWFFS